MRTSMASLARMFGLDPRVVYSSDVGKTPIGRMVQAEDIIELRMRSRSKFVLESDVKDKIMRKEIARIFHG